MAEINNQIYKLAKQFTKNLPEDIPEGILYGCLKFCGMNETSIDFLLSNEGIEDTIEIKAQILKVKDILKDNNLEPELMKRGLPQILRILSREADNRGYEDIVTNYDVSTDVETIITDAVKLMPREEYEVFQIGKSISDVIAYQKTLTKQKSFEGKSFSEAIEKVSKKPAKNDGDEAQIIEDIAEMLHIDENTSEDDIRKAIESIITLEEVSPDVLDSMDEILVDDMIDDSINATGEDKVYAEQLISYLEELESLIPTFKAMGDVKFLWSQSLLVSIDDGYGLTTFLEKISDAYIKNGLANGKDASGLMGEIVIDNPPDRDHKYDSWDAVLNVLKDYPKSLDENKIYGVLCVDLSQWVAELDSYKVKEYLRKINDKKRPVLLIFRVPYMEYRIVSDIEASLSDIMGIRKVVVPPISIDQMIDYLVNRGAKFGYSFNSDCREKLELGIIAEKNDGHFYGFRTLNKLFESIVYSKIKYNSYNCFKDKNITGVQLVEFLNLNNRELTCAEMLEQMVGVDDIIKQIDTKIKQIKVAQEMAENGSQVERPSIHMMFKGSPGTGKTTIARIVAKKLKEAGILSKGNLYEIKGRDLCGRYIGETTPKTCAYCRDAYGSVLFIDEAYELYRGQESSERDYGREALTALVAEMENHRDDMCVIFAGYSDDMDEMVKGNLGLESRIPIVIDFPNYSKEELEQIFIKMLEQNFEYEPSLRDAVHEYFDSISKDALDSKEFSNARFVRNLFESVWGEAALRYDLGNEEKIVIKSNDFKTATDKIDFKKFEEKKHRPMGFVTE